MGAWVSLLCLNGDRGSFCDNYRAADNGVTWTRSDVGVISGRCRGDVESELQVTAEGTLPTTMSRQPNLKDVSAGARSRPADFSRLPLRGNRGIRRRRCEGDEANVHGTTLTGAALCICDVVDSTDCRMRLEKPDALTRRDLMSLSVIEEPS